MSTNLHLSKWARQFFTNMWHLVTLFIAHKTADESHTLRYSQVIEHTIKDHFCHQQFISATQTKHTGLKARTVETAGFSVMTDYTLQQACPTGARDILSWRPNLLCQL
jgi:hypothetical protein